MSPTTGAQRAQLLRLSGELLTQSQDGREFLLAAGKSYQAVDGDAIHRSSTVAGATRFIVD